MKIKIIKTSVEWQEKGKAKWQKLNVVFHNDSTGRVDGRNILSFTNKDVFSVLSASQKDEVYDITEVQNAKGYPEIVKIEKLDSSAVAVPASTSETTPSKSTPAPRSNFETPEERAKRQELIVRQSSLSNAIAVLTVGAKGPLDANTVEALADRFVDYVFDKPDVMAEIAAMDDDIPEAE